MVIMSARKRWLQRANAWIAGGGSVPEEEEIAEARADGEGEGERESGGLVAEPAPVATRGTFGWAARSGTRAATAEPAEVSSENKERDSELQGRLESERKGWDEERRQLEERASGAEAEAAKLQSALEAKTAHVNEQGKELAEVRSRLRDMESARDEDLGEENLKLEHERALKILQERIDSVEAANGDLRGQLVKAEEQGEKLRELHEALEAETARYQSADREREEASIQVRTLEKCLDRRDTRLSARRHRLMALLRQGKEREKSVENLQTELQVAREHRSRVVTELAQVKGRGGDLERLGAERDELRGVVESTKDELTKLREEAALGQAVKASLEKCEGELSELRRDHDVLQSGKAAADAALAEAQSKVDALSKSNEEQETLLQERKSDMDDLRDALADMRRERQDAIKDDNEKAQLVVTRERELSEARDQLAALNSDKFALEDELGRVTAEWKEAVAAGERREMEEESAERLRAEAERENVRLAEEKLRLEQARTSRLEAELEALRSKADEAGTASGDAHDLLRQRDSDLAEREQQVNTLQHELAGFSSLLEDRESRNAGLEKHLEQVRDEHQNREATLKRALAEVGRSKEQLQAQLEDTRGALHEVSRELEGKRRQIAHLDERLKEAQDSTAETEKLSEDASQWRMKVAAHESTLRERKKEIEALTKRCQGLEAQLEDRASRQIAKVANEKERLKAAIEARDQDMRRNEEALNQARQELRTVKRQLDERVRELTLVQKDMDRLRDTGSRAVSEAREASKEVDRLQVELAEKERRMETLNARIERERGNFSREDEALSQKVRHLERALQDRERDLKEREGDYRRLHGEVESLRADLRVSEARLKRNDEERGKAHRTGAHASQAKLAQTEALVDRWKDKCKALEEEVMGLRKEARQSPQGAASGDGAVEQDGRLEYLRSQLEISQSQVDGLQDRLTRLEYEKHELEHRLKSAEKPADQAKPDVVERVEDGS